MHNNAKAKAIQRAEMESILSMKGVNKVRAERGMGKGEGEGERVGGVLSRAASSTDFLFFARQIFDDDRWREAQSKPLSEFVTLPRPEPVEVAPLAEL